MNWVKEIEEALVEHRNLEITYDQQRRVVSPHIFGVSTADHILISGYQIKNYDDPAFEPHWRTFDLQKVEDLKILSQRFHPRVDYNPKDKNFTQIMGQV